MNKPKVSLGHLLATRGFWWWSPTTLHAAHQSQHTLLHTHLPAYPYRGFTPSPGASKIPSAAGINHPQTPATIKPSPHHYGDTRVLGGEDSEKSDRDAILASDQPESSASSTVTPPFSKKVHSGLIDIGQGHYINTLRIEHASAEASPSHPESLEPPSTSFSEALSQNAPQSLLKMPPPSPNSKVLVMTHGYGAGLGFFYKNYAALSSVPGYTTYAIDWLGYGNSSRPRFPRFKNVRQTEDWFIDSLETWRSINQIESMTLMGHSLGGYLSTCYALKYPERVEKLILVSPVGVPPKPEPNPSASSARPSWLSSVFTQLWSWNITPMNVIRTSGPFGPQLVRQYTSRRFGHLDPQDAEALHAYLYHISSQPGSGEYALSHLLSPGAWAKEPLADRLPHLRMPTTFIYGDQDWMDHRHVLPVLPRMPQGAKIAIVQDAGHHLYLDNPTAFNAAMNAELRGVDTTRTRLPNVAFIHSPA